MKTNHPDILKLHEDLIAHGEHLSVDDVLWIVMSLRMIAVAAEGSVALELPRGAQLEAVPDDEGGISLAMLLDDLDLEDGDVQQLSG